MHLSYSRNKLLPHLFQAVSNKKGQAVKKL